MVLVVEKTVTTDKIWLELSLSSLEKKWGVTKYASWGTRGHPLCLGGKLRPSTKTHAESSPLSPLSNKILKLKLKEHLFHGLRKLLETHYGGLLEWEKMKLYSWRKGTGTFRVIHKTHRFTVPDEDWGLIRTSEKATPSPTTLSNKTSVKITEESSWCGSKR